MVQTRARQPHVGVALVGDMSAARFAELVRLVDELGYDDVWVPDERFYRDVYPSMTLAALTSPRLRIGSAVTDPYSRHPAITAAAMATVDEIAGGRCLLGIGAGYAGFRAMGIRRERPAARLRDAIALMRALWRGGPVTYDGQTLAFDGQLNFAARPTIPIVVAGRGPAILEVGGEVADAVMIGTFASEPGIRYAQAHIARGAARAGRDPRAIPTLSWLYIAIDTERDVARYRARRGVGIAIAGSREILDTIGIRLPPDLLALLDSAEYNLADAGFVRRVMERIPDELVDHLAVAGTVDEVAERLVRIIRLGIDGIAAWPFPPAETDVEQVIVPLAQEVMPRVRRALGAE
jgi:5,10-methylenetetrahydromethanopterin reductase